MSVDPTMPLHTVIRASAGTGKTYRLTVRYLSLLRLKVEPRTILATTFTRKAAGEILGRVLRRLAVALTDDAALDQLAADLAGEQLQKGSGLGPLTREECRAMLGTLIEDLPRVRIGTLDSFFHSVLQAFRVELNVPLDPRMIDDGGSEARQLRQRAIEAMLAQTLVRDTAEPEGEHFATLIARLREVHHDARKRSVTGSLDTLLSGMYDGYRLAPDAALWQQVESPGLLKEDRLEAAVQALREAQPLLPRKKSDGKIYSVYDNAWNKEVRCANEGDWATFMVGGISGKVNEGLVKFGPALIPPPLIELYHPLIRHAKAVTLQQFARQTLATFALLDAFHQHYLEARTSERVMLFSDLTHLLVGGLGEMDEARLQDLYFRLDGRIRHLLIDEFQDTSLPQWAVLRPMVEEVLQSGEQRTFFCVGDEKQSIYGWRGGCPDLLERVAEDVASEGVETPGEVEVLTHSYRSAEIVLDAVNRVFSSLAGVEKLVEQPPAEEAAQRWEEAFEPHQSAGAAANLPGHVLVMTSPTPPEELPEDVAEASDAQAMAGLTHEQWVAYQVKDLHDTKPGASIAVLMRSNDAAVEMLHHLRTLRVDASGEGGNPVADHPAVAAVLAAMTLADHPTDRLAAFHVANSPLGTLLELTEADEAAQVVKVAAALRRRLADSGYAKVIADWTRQLTPHLDARGARRLRQLISVAERYDEVASLRPSGFVRFALASRAEDPSAAAVRVLTVHKAKGLEFDAVVLPELEGRFNDQSQLLLDRPEPLADVQAVFRWPKKELRAVSEQLQAAWERAVRAERFEDLCLLYVAMTRARQALHLYLQPLKGTRNQPNALSTVIRGTLSEIDIEAESLEGEEVLLETGDAAWALPTGRADEQRHEAAKEKVTREVGRLAKAGKRRVRGVVRPSEGGGRSGVLVRDILGADASGPARRRGRVWHAWLARVEEVETLPTDEPLRADAVREGLPPEPTRELLGHWADAVEAPEGPLRAALETEGADEVWRERAVLALEGENLVRAKVDRVLVWRGDDREPSRARVIDFKTEPPDDAALEIHSPQLLAYRDAVASLLSLPPERVEMRLVFVPGGETLELDSEAVTRSP